MITHRFLSNNLTPVKVLAYGTLDNVYIGPTDRPELSDELILVIVFDKCTIKIKPKSGYRFRMVS